jgi:hypothetical protein
MGHLKKKIFLKNCQFEHFKLKKQRFAAIFYSAAILYYAAILNLVAILNFFTWQHLKKRYLAQNL